MLDGVTRQGGAPWEGGRAPHPRGPPLDPLTCFSSSVCVIFSKNISHEGFIPFGLRLIFFFCKTLKQAKNNNLDWAFGLVGVVELTRQMSGLTDLVEEPSH